jgi:hypothetical protein
MYRICWSLFVEDVLCGSIVRGNWQAQLMFAFEASFYGQRMSHNSKPLRLTEGSGKAQVDDEADVVAAL